MNNKHLEKIKQQYEEREIIPSSSVWEMLEKKLSPEHTTPVIVYRKRRGWIKYAAVLILLAGSAIIWLMNDESEEKIIRAPDSQIVGIQEKTTFPDVKYNRKQLPKHQETTPESQQIIKANVHIVSNQSIEPLHEKMPDREKVIMEMPVPQIVAKETPEVMAVENQQKKYIMASDLLFSRKMDKTRNLDHENDLRMGARENSIKPDFISVLGARIYKENDE